MKFNKMLTITYAILVIVGTSASIYSTRIATQKKQIKQELRRYMSGKIINIDEDSFAISGGNGPGANFTFENLKIKTKEGLEYILINPGPSSYSIGDQVIQLGYTELAKKQIAFKELHQSSSQEGYIKAEGVIKLN